MTIATSKIKQSTRLLFLDVFRGMTIAVMILVNASDGELSYPWLLHADWNGCKLADLVFPFFIFIVGISLVFSLNKQRTKGISKSTLIAEISQRSLIIFAIGLFLSGFPHHFSFDSLRIYGILQRIALCYFCAALLYLLTTVRTQFLILWGLLIGYWLLMMYIPVVGFSRGDLSPSGNVAAAADRVIFTSSHLFGKVFDPEGLLSTLPALATALLGNLTGVWLISKSTPQRKACGMGLIGIVALLTGWLCDGWFPINKALWTSSFVLWTGGLALITLTVCYVLIEVKQWCGWTKPFEIFGVNAMAAFFLHVFFLKLQMMLQVTALDGTQSSLRSYLTHSLAHYLSPANAALVYAIGTLLVWFVVLSILYRRKIYIKV